ncbi:MAG: penicillin-binding protein 2, partial [Candidatus Doudnabacteria bacterium]|nr:penicillin-binding protein 2 [Candidatus Doudnabacteria bacterium]
MENPFEIKSSVSKKIDKGLEWEESAVDNFSPVENGVFDAERTNPKFNWLIGFLILTFLLLSGRVFYLQVFKGKYFQQLSENNRLRRQVILAPRGSILDRYGQPLALNTASFNLVAVPLDLPRGEMEDQVVELARLFNLDSQEILNKLKQVDPKSIQPILIKQDLSQQEAILFETKASDFVGFSVQKIPIRRYLDPLVFSHILGFTGIVSPADLEKTSKILYDFNDYIGKTGIELEYEKYLHGVNGENLVEVDASGKLLNVLGENVALPGKTAVLNIDKELQKKLFNELFKEPEGRVKAAAIALNPKTGQVLALLSLPGFDNNWFAHGIKPQQYQSLLDDKALPMFNRSIQGTYPPGSTVKPMVAAAALEEQVVDENTAIADKGVLVIPNQFDPKMAYNFYGWKRDGLGVMNVVSAIAQSSDIYFYTVAGGHPNSRIKGLGAEKLAEYYRKFNLGKLTGIDLQGEKPGLVADPDWKAEYFKKDPILKKWYLGDTYHIGIGQGDMLATPLQVAMWTAIIANDGTGLKPEILDKILDEKDRVVFQNQREVLVEKFLSDKNLKIIQEGMRQTVLSGSGKQLSSLPISSAGKTGTSQFDGSDPKKTHAWFTAYAP